MNQDIVLLINMKSNNFNDPIKSRFDMSIDMGDKPVKFWIEKGTVYPVKYSMDMSMVMNRLMTVIYAEATPGTDIEVVVSKCLVEMTMSNINKAEDFKIPEEVLMVK